MLNIHEIDIENGGACHIDNFPPLDLSFMANQDFSYAEDWGE